MNNLKARMLVPSTPAPVRTGRHSHSIPKVGVVISHTHQRVRIRDLDHIHKDVLIQGDEMRKFQDDLREACKIMPNIPIGDALYIVTAPFIAGRWS